ncbi:MAG: hypothetical protein ACYDCN_01400 [Bacteroidia bacterium]
MQKTRPKSTLQSFNDELVALVPYIIANQSRLNASAGNITQIENEVGPPIPARGHDNATPGTWYYLFPRHQDPATKNEPDTRALNALMSLIKTTITGIWDDSPKSARVDGDYTAFKRKKRGGSNTPSPDPAGHAPVISKDENLSVSGLLALRIQNPLTPKSKKKAYPSWKYEVQTATIDTPLPPARQTGTPTARVLPVFTIEGICGKWLHKIILDVTNNAGQTLLIRVRCRNPQGKVSEWSNVLSIIIG